MILPVPSGAKNPFRFPVTVWLVLMNLVLYFYVDHQVVVIDEAMEKILKKSDFIFTQGEIYLQYLKAQPSSPSGIIQRKMRLAEQGSEEAIEFLGGQLALQDGGFLKMATNIQWQGDQVAIRDWLKNHIELQALRESHPLYTLGLHSGRTSWQQTLTYQFAHSGLSHLLFNMFFLIVFGCLLEPLMGGLAFLALYLTCGLGAALAFTLLSGLSAIPLVGASGALGGLIGATLILGFRMQHTFFSYVGMVRLPYWIWFFYFWLLADLAGLLKAVPVLGMQVAHTAHIGGTLVGLILGLVYRYFTGNLIEASPAEPTFQSFVEMQKRPSV